MYHKNIVRYYQAWVETSERAGGLSEMGESEVESVPLEGLLEATSMSSMAIRPGGPRIEIVSEEDGGAIASSDESGTDSGGGEEDGIDEDGGDDDDDDEEEESEEEGGWLGGIQTWRRSGKRRHRRGRPSSPVILSVTPSKPAAKIIFGNEDEDEEEDQYTGGSGLLDLRNSRSRSLTSTPQYGLIMEVLSKGDGSNMPKEAPSAPKSRQTSQLTKQLYIQMEYCEEVSHF